MSEELTQHMPSDDMRLILARFDSLESHLGNVEHRLDTLEEKVDRRLQETRPIWESVLEQLKEMNARLDRVEKDYRVLRRVVQSNMIEVVRGQDDLEERVEALEGRDT